MLDEKKMALRVVIDVKFTEDAVSSEKSLDKREERGRAKL